MPLLSRHNLNTVQLLILFITSNSTLTAQTTDFINTPESKIVAEFMENLCISSKQVHLIAPSYWESIKLDRNEVNINCWFSDFESYITDKENNMITAYLNMGDDSYRKLDFIIVKEDDNYYIMPPEGQKVNKRNRWMTPWSNNYAWFDRPSEVEALNKRIAKLRSELNDVGIEKESFTRGDILQNHDYIKTGRSEVVKDFLNGKRGKDAINPNWWKGIEKNNGLSKEDLDLKELPEFKNFNILFDYNGRVHVAIQKPDETWQLIVFNVGGDHSNAYINPELDGSSVKAFAQSTIQNEKGVESIVLAMSHGASLGVPPIYLWETKLTADLLKNTLAEDNFENIHRAAYFVDERTGLGEYKLNTKKGYDYVMILYSPEKQPISPVAVLKEGDKTFSYNDFFQDYKLPGALSTLPTKLSKAVHRSDSEAQFSIDIISKEGVKFVTLDVYEVKRK